jgi:hypothetical protein
MQLDAPGCTWMHLDAAVYVGCRMLEASGMRHLDAYNGLLFLCFCWVLVAVLAFGCMY